MISESDKATIIGCCMGKKAALENLVRLYSNLVYSTVLRTYGVKNLRCPEHEIDDLHNTVFMRLLERRCRRLRQFKGKNGCSLASWIRVVTVRTVLDHLRQTRDALSRSSKLENIDKLVHVKADLPEAWQLLDNIGKREVIDRAMASLPPRDRLFITLYFMEGNTQSTIAEILKISRNAVYSVKHRAIKRIKEIITKDQKIN